MASKLYKSNGHYVDDKVVAEIRADAIGEFLKKDKECQQKGGECPYMYSEISCVECIAEQLKEINNENTK